jgi:hypothetical protein
MSPRDRMADALARPGPNPMLKTPKRARGGSEFHSNETDLVTDLIGNLPAYLQRASTTCSIHREVGVGRSIADVVAALMPEKAVRVPPPLSVQESVLISALRSNGPTRIDVLEQLCGMTPKSLRGGALNRLETAGVVARGDGGRISLGRWCRSGSLIAIEAKLTRWLDALEQASVYRQFADRVYVALPADCVQPAMRARAMFERAGVGLLSVNGEIRCEIRAQALGAHDWRREYVYSRLARAPLSAPTSPASD